MTAIRKATSLNELERNNLDAVFKVTDKISQWDHCQMCGGRVIEVPSEHMCQGFIQGYTLSGHMWIFGEFSWYHKMMIHHAKFIIMVSLRLAL
ncbi:uncharacterized protein N7483_001234 [Penicillium malachiteum]|uniref:uncharacterized protein n=1 Tax=Penicillium malachiteum TaxID=1324776 RepID=UPI0025468E71|nr:uncharacterized protein N7483_001234 [Penicillium malachiteum]KAJ5736109.1 hypothetical protein N7483_001234 [Penicillium malachiteum]